MGRPSQNRRRVVLGLAAAAVIGSVTRVSEAAPPRIEVVGDVEGCPPADELRRAIAEQLGRDVADESNVTVRVRRADGGTLVADVTLTTREGTSTRSLGGGGDTCRDLVRAGALTIALALEKEAPREPEKKAAPAPVPPPDRDFASGERSLRSDRIVVTASAVTSLGLLPRPAAGAGGALRFRISEALWVSGRGMWLPGASMPNEAFSARLVTGGLGICAEPFASGRVAAVGCVHAVVGSYDVVDPRVAMASSDTIYAAGTLSAGIRARAIGPIHVEAMADAHLPVVRPTLLTAVCPPSGFEPPFAALALLAGAGVSIP